MKIAIVSKLWERTDPYSTGGTGVSIGNLVDGLVERGHKVTLFATADSKTKAQKLIAVRKKPYRNDYSEISEYDNIASAFQRHREYDIIHCAVEHKSLIFGDTVATPSLHSIRYGEFFSDEMKQLKKYKFLNFVANSKAIKKKFSFLNWQGCIYNGLDMRLYPFNSRAGKYLLHLGRISPQKGPDVSIRVAMASKSKLIIAGKTVTADKAYLDVHVFPYIDDKEISYVGEANFKKKITLMKNAYAYLHPVNFFEACANTLIESMACGTPVIAYDKGSNSELVKHGQTGLIVKTEKGLLEAINRIGEIKREDCRFHAEHKFGRDPMVSEYEKLYTRIIKKHKK